MILNCVFCGDFSPLYPVSQKDNIYISEALKIKVERENNLTILLADLVFLLTRISVSLTGDQGMNFLPSKIAEMSRNYERFYGNK